MVSSYEEPSQLVTLQVQQQGQGQVSQAAKEVDDCLKSKLHQVYKGSFKADRLTFFFSLGADGRFDQCKKFIPSLMNKADFFPFAEWCIS